MAKKKREHVVFDQMLKPKKNITFSLVNKQNAKSKRIKRYEAMYDCGFTKENNWFRYRAAAIIVENDCVLFASNEKDDYLYSIGGGVHMGETAQDAVCREVFEETGVHYEIDRLAVIHENFFDENGGSLKGFTCHEISFFFLMKSRGTQELHSNSMTQGVKEEMRWIPIKDLDKYKAFPLFLKDYLRKEHSGIEHIVTDERLMGSKIMS